MPRDRWKLGSAMSRRDIGELTSVQTMSERVEWRSTGRVMELAGVRCSWQSL